MRFLTLLAGVLAALAALWLLMVAGFLIVAYEGAVRLCAWAWEPIRGNIPSSGLVGLPQVKP